MKTLMIWKILQLEVGTSLKQMGTWKRSGVLDALQQHNLYSSPGRVQFDK